MIQAYFTYSSKFRPTDKKALSILLDRINTGTDRRFTQRISPDGAAWFSCLGRLRGLNTDSGTHYSDESVLSKLMPLIPLQQAIVIRTIRMDFDGAVSLDALRIAQEEEAWVVTHNTWEKAKPGTDIVKRARQLVGIAPNYEGLPLEGGELL